MVWCEVAAGGVPGQIRRVDTRTVAVGDVRSVGYDRSGPAVGLGGVNGRFGVGCGWPMVSGWGAGRVGMVHKAGRSCWWARRPERAYGTKLPGWRARLWGHCVIIRCSRVAQLHESVLVARWGPKFYLGKKMPIVQF